MVASHGSCLVKDFLKSNVYILAKAVNAMPVSLKQCGLQQSP